MKLERQVIEDFGRQWTKYTTNEGYYGSLELFKDIISPLISIEEIKNTDVAEIGSGTGRIVKMLLDAGVNHVTAIEPSDAFSVMEKNLSNFGPNVIERVSIIKCTGDEIPKNIKVDYIFSIGVLHHIPNPRPVMKAAYNALKPGGKIIIWLYGKEGNELYLLMVDTIRCLSKYLPHVILSVVVWLLYWPLAIYIHISKVMPVPMRKYMVDVIGKMSPVKRRLVIYDQLNPIYAKYYTHDEALKLLSDANFTNIKIHHRHGYSWTVTGNKSV